MNGKDWPGLKSIVTICPVEFAEPARVIAAEFLDNGELAADMLDVEVRTIGATETTHILCERLAFGDEADAQASFMASKNLPWVSGELHSLNKGLQPMFMTFIKEDEDALTILGLEKL